MTPRRMLYHKELTHQSSSHLRIPILTNPIQPLSYTQPIGKVHDQAHQLNSIERVEYDTIGKHRSYRLLDDTHPLRPRQPMFPRFSPVHPWPDANVVLPIHTHQVPQRGQYNNSSHYDNNGVRPTFKPLPRVQSMIGQPTVDKHRSDVDVEQSTVQRDEHWRKRSRSNDEEVAPRYVSSDTSPPVPVSTNQRSSRYLREMDRHAILQRIEQGEKQSTIAKEYQVSRSTICNLYKNRQAIYSRTDADPHARHPKKKMKTSLMLPTTSMVSSSIPSLSHPHFVQVVSPPSCTVNDVEKGTIIELETRAIRLMLTKLECRETSREDFDHSLERVMRLVQEEALAIMTSMPKGNGHQPLYAISIEQQQYLMLDVFHRLEPNRPTGSVHFYKQRLSNCYHHKSTMVDDMVTFQDPNLPESLCDCSIVLLALRIDSTTKLNAVLRQLHARGAFMSRITLVTLFIDDDTLIKLQSIYPSLHVITAQVEQHRQPHCATSTLILNRLESESTRRDGILSKWS